MFHRTYFLFYNDFCGFRVYKLRFFALFLHIYQSSKQCCDAADRQQLPADQAGGSTVCSGRWRRCSMADETRLTRTWRSLDQSKCQFIRRLIRFSGSPAACKHALKATPKGQTWTTVFHSRHSLPVGDKRSFHELKVDTTDLSLGLTPMKENCAVRNVKCMHSQWRNFGRKSGKTKLDVNLWSGGFVPHSKKVGVRPSLKLRLCA